MPAIFVKGDLFADERLDALAHGCNCAGAMGKGIAVEFRRRFPDMYAEYKRRCADGRFGLGDVFVWAGREHAPTKDVTVFNLGTQQSWRSRADLSAVGVALRRMVRACEERGIKTVGLPRIGAGLGGLPWADVRALVASVGATTPVELVVFEEVVPGASAERLP